MNLLKRIFSDREYLYFFLILIFFSLLRLPSLFEPNWYGDEGIYQVLGHAIRQGRILYSGIWDNKPPLLYLTYAVVDANQFLIRFLSYLAGLFAVFGFYLLSKLLFKNTVARFLATGIFALLFSLPVTEANIANAENFMLVFLIFAAYFIFNAGAKNYNENLRAFFISGLLVSVAALYKIVAVFDFAAFFLFITFILLPVRLSAQKKSLLKDMRPVIVFTLGFILPLLLTATYFFFAGAFFPFLTATFTNNVSYVGYKNYFLFPQGLLVTKLLLLSGFVFLLFWKRNSLPKNILLILFWFAFSLFNVFFSQRPYTHYVLVAIASTSLLIGLIASERKYRLIGIPLFGLGILAIFLTFGPIKPARVFGYYTNFTQYVLGQKSTSNYRSFFDSDVPRDYEIAEFLKSQLKNDSKRIIFIWGNTAQIYTLSNTLPPGRYTVAYHISSEKALIETQRAIDMEKPSFIVLLPDSPIPQIRITEYTLKAMIKNAAIYERTH